MVMRVIDEKDFPAIIEIYNSKGRLAANAYIRESYGIKTPWSVMKRIRKAPGFEYDAEEDRFKSTDGRSDESIFMSMSELCGNRGNTSVSADHAASRASASMEKLVHEFISDRLLELSRYVTLETSSRTILIDRTSMQADGYKVVTH